ncbi:hypothetical protein EK21DRAFT_106329 [Setomelanomma holmii]|uniref:Uncharacterized protein n=1 Tax=Setomelanomma holmii TaxID=210430 RepID=A0A9P4LUZ5_9PLEO|nr:hypothetical protein EK21DRAFT_106329 [Setomelanomma holmii]
MPTALPTFAAQSPIYQSRSKRQVRHDATLDGIAEEDEDTTEEDLFLAVAANSLAQKPRAKGHTRHDSALEAVLEEQEEYANGEDNGGSAGPESASTFYLNIAATLWHDAMHLLYDSDDLALPPSPHRAPPQHLTSTPDSPFWYTYTPIATRSSGYESLRDDHGIRFKPRFCLSNLLPKWRYSRLQSRSRTSEDRRCKLRKWIVASMGRKKERLKRWFCFVHR